MAKIPRKTEQAPFRSQQAISDGNSFFTSKNKLYIQSAYRVISDWRLPQRRGRIDIWRHWRIVQKLQRLCDLWWVLSYSTPVVEGKWHKWGASHFQTNFRRHLRWIPEWNCDWVKHAVFRVQNADNPSLQALGGVEKICGGIESKGEENKASHEFDNFPKVHEFCDADRALWPVHRHRDLKW